MCGRRASSPTPSAPSRAPARRRPWTGLSAMVSTPRGQQLWRPLRRLTAHSFGQPAEGAPRRRRSACQWPCKKIRTKWCKAALLAASPRLASLPASLFHSCERTSHSACTPLRHALLLLPAATHLSCLSCSPTSPHVPDSFLYRPQPGAGLSGRCRATNILSVTPASSTVGSCKGAKAQR